MEIERDMPECDVHNMDIDELSEWAERGDEKAKAELRRRTQHNVHEPTTYERKTLMETTMGADFSRFFYDEQYEKHLFDAKHPI